MKLAPGPGRRDLFKRSFKFETRSYEMDFSLREKFGHQVRIAWPEVKHLLYHPNDFEHVLKTHSTKYRRGSQLGALLGKSIATSEGEYWKQQKKIIGREFHQTEFPKYYPEVIGLVDQLVQSWGQKKTINVSDEFMEFTFKVAAQSLFGSEVGVSDIATVKRSIKQLSDFAIRLIYAPIKLPALVPTPSKINAFLAVRKINGIIDRIICDFRSGRKTSDNILSRLMKDLTDSQVRSESFTLLLAGHETTSNALTWCLFELAKNLHYQEKAYAEIEGVIGRGMPDLSNVDEIKSVDHILKEAMRLYPPFPLLSRTASVDDEINGFYIPKDSRVYCMTYVSHRLPEFWKDAESFRPERFETDERHAFSFLPFGGGQRKCVGADFAMLEMKLILTRIIQTFSFSLESSPDVKPLALVTLVPNGEVVLKLKSRSL